MMVIHTDACHNAASLAQVRIVILTPPRTNYHPRGEHRIYQTQKKNMQPNSPKCKTASRGMHRQTDC